MSAKVYDFEINGRRFKLSLKKVDDHNLCAQYTDLTTNKTYSRILDIRRLTNASTNIIVEGQALTITTLKKQNDKSDHYEVDINDKRLKIKHLDRRKPSSLQGNRASASAKDGEAQIVAPMPGKIIQLTKEVGDKVQPGEGLVVLEAMKMENEMRSEVTGQVTEILVKPGQKVETGALILKIKCQG